MTKKQINDLSHELYTTVAGSIAIQKSIEETVDLMSDIIRETLKQDISRNNKNRMIYYWNRKDIQT